MKIIIKSEGVKEECALSLVLAVINKGRISSNNRYCLCSVIRGYTIYADKSKSGTDTFTILTKP